MMKYRLDDLGWYQFEQLCQSLLKARIGLDVQAWGGHSDQGRDAYLPKREPVLGLGEGQGPYVFQSKFVENANAAGARPVPNLMAALSKEARVIQARLNAGTWSDIGTYVLMTNCMLDAKGRTKVEDKLRKMLPEAAVQVWTGQDICSVLDDCPNVRNSFPQLLRPAEVARLLSEVLDKTLLEKSRLALERASELAQTFVPTRTFWQTLDRLEQYSFAVLTGPPEVGKTTIARLIGLVKSLEGWEYIECRRPDDLFQRRSSNPQIFVADDAFGSTEYRPELGATWGREMDFVLRELDRSHWLIWTSRTTPLSMALQRMHLQGKGELFPAAGQIAIDASELLPLERALILYAHAKSASLSTEARVLLKGVASGVVKNRHFTPERARRLVTSKLEELSKGKIAPEAPKAIEEAIELEIQEPTVAMRKSFQALDREHQLVLMACLDLDDKQFPLEELQRVARSVFPALPGSIDQIIEDLDGHFLRQCTEASHRDGRWYWHRVVYEWTHPSWRDLVIEQLTGDEEARRTFLSNCGAKGVSLALSVGGGGSGAREFPLLVVAQDWELMADSCSRLLLSEPSQEPGRSANSILWGIHRALKEMPAQGHVAAQESLQALARMALEACRNAWRGQGDLFVYDALRVYYEISEFLEPLPPGPDLSTVWRAQIEELENAIKAGKLNGVLWSLWGLTDFIKIVERNEPRFLRQVGFPASWEPIVGWLLPRAESFLEGLERIKFPDAVGHLDEEAGLLSSVLDDLPQWFAAHAERMRRLSDKAEKEEVRLGKLRRSLYQLVSPEPRNRVEDAEIDVGAIFSDL